VDAALHLPSVQARLIDQALAECDGNISEAARRLGISRNTIYRRRRQNGGR